MIKLHGCKRFLAIFMIALMLGTMLSGIIIPTKTVRAEDAAIVSLSATYSGDAVLIGKDIDVSKLKVTATYEDGVSNDITDYTIVSKTVKEEGSNLLMVIYQGKVANFYVVGKKISSLYAYYSGGLLSIGNSVSKKDVKVMAQFTNGTSEFLTDFTVNNHVITKEGQNEVYVVCENQMLKVSVWGMKPKEISALYATYSGGEVTVGNSVNRDNLQITAAYKDGSSEVINNYVLTPEVIGSTGTQTVVAMYMGKTVSFNVTGAHKTMTGISVKYLGGTVGVGYSVRPADVIVTATYNDGSTGQVKDFNLLSSTITYVGYQVVTAEAGGFKAEFIVQGVSEQAIDFTNSNTFSITNGTDTAKVYISLPSNVDKGSLTGSSIKNSVVSKILTRAVRNSSYISFVIEEKTEAVLDEFPLTMKIELPKGFTLEGSSLYYTPNRKSIIGKMSTVSLAPNLLIVDIHNPGTYILSFKK